MGDYIIELLIGVVLVAIFAIVIYIINKKSNNNFEEILKSVSDDKKQILIDTPYGSVPNLPYGAIVTAMIYEIKQKSSGGVSLNAMYYNTYFPNFRDQITYMNVTASAKEMQGHELKNGDFIKVLLNQDKFPKIVF